MKTTLSLLCLATTLSLPSHAREPEPVSSRIESVGMFKNGLCLVRRTVQVDGPGRYRLDALPQPVHGTWWIESDAVVHTRATTVDVEVPRERVPNPDFQDDLAGSEVTVFFAGESIPPVTGTVLATDHTQENSWDRRYETRTPSRGPWPWRQHPSSTTAPTPPRFLLLETARGISYIDRGRIAYLQAKTASRTVTREEPALLFDVSETTAPTSTITIHYLTKGMAWAPSYQLDITDPDTLALQQKAVIRNELEDLDDVDLFLISGFPSIEFSHALSPLASTSTWASFFSQLSQRQQPARRHATISQQAVLFNSVRPVEDVSAAAIPTGEGVDLHYQPIGRHRLQEGDAVSLDVAEATAGYRRIVEWTIPDTRTPLGRYIEEHMRQQDPEKYDESAWDALRFANPLSFPLTTGPAMVMDGGRFNGQQIVGWANPGEETTLRVTKSLSLRTTHFELEVPEPEREVVYVGGRSFRKVRVRGEMRTTNHRAEPVEIVVRRRFSGDVVSAEGSPRESLLESGVYAVNKRNELIWTVHLDPGADTQLDYQYDVLVRH